MSKSKGLGDTVAKITKFFKIDKLVKSIDEDCGCDKRQEFLNKVVPYKSSKKDESIFVQIAAYRDPELNNTLEDLFKNATNPDNLKVCVAWQHDTKDEWDQLDKYQNDDRVLILDIPYKESNGVCWARNMIQQYYTDETYTLQLDSHHRFIKNWDTELINMYKGLQKKGHKKPLITSYLPSYFPEKDPKDRTIECWQQDFNRFTPEGYIFTFPSLISGWENLDSPVPGRFYSAHFAFAAGEFCNEVQHDPQMYFHGEEPSIAARAFTWGYDIFHPHKIIAWHFYSRNGFVKHWDDHDNWNAIDDASHLRYRTLHEMDGHKCTPCAKKSLGKYYFGEVRTLEEYERFAGLKFGDRTVTQFTLDRKTPPNPKEEYEGMLRPHFKHCIDVHQDHFHEDDYDFWVVSFEMEDGTVVDRQDADANEVITLLKQAKGDDGWVRIWREFFGQKPDKWVIWPHSESKGFIERYEVKLNKGIEPPQ
jgi:hypothetical protein